MTRLYTVSIPDFGRGVNDHDPADKIAYNECLNPSRNTRSDGMSFKQRNGYVKAFDAVTGSTDGIRAIGAYTRISAANDRMIWVYNNKIYKVLPGTDTAGTEIVQSFLTSSENIDILSFRDWMFVLNGVDKPLRVADTTVTQDFVPPASLTATTFLPAFGEVFQNSLWVSGVPSNPNVVYISRASTTTNPEYAYDFSGSLNGYGDAAEILFPSRVTAIRKLSSAIVIFTIDGAIYIPGLIDYGTSIVWEQQPIGGASGCVAQKACVAVENDLYYVTPQKEIKSIKRGFADNLSVITVPLSKKVERFIKDRIDNDITDTFGVYDEVGKFCYFYFREAGQPFNSMRLVADINDVDQNTGAPSWNIDNNVPFQCAYSYKGVMYTGSVLLGQVYQDDTGTADDDDANIAAEFVTKDFNSNNPTTYKRFKDVRVFGEISQSTEHYIDVYVDGILVATETVNPSNLPTGSSIFEGGIGTNPVGDQTIGVDDGDEETSDVRFEYIKRVDLRASGYKIRIVIRSDGNTNDYRIRYAEYSFVPRGRLFYPVREQ